MASRSMQARRAEAGGGGARDRESPIRLMIVDDSIVARAVISRMLEPRPEFEIVGSAANVDQALELLDRVLVDIILLDVEMPGTDGLTALPTLLARSRGARVLIVSSAAEQGAAATIKALTLGAADTLLKPGAGNFAGRFAEALAERLLRIGPAARDPSPRHGAPQSPAPPGITAPAVPAAPEQDGPPPAPSGPIECLAIGASTGGVNALTALFKALPARFDVPILITQHLPAVFMPYFVAQLREIAGRTAILATEGARLQPGEILVAPGDGHLCLVRGRDAVRVHIDRARAASGCMPSVDPMLASLARVFGAGGVGVVLSGMGRDGLLGATEMAASGGEILVQNAETSVVWGMPGAVANAGLAAAVLDPARIARRIGQRAGTWGGPDDKATSWK